MFFSYRDYLSHAQKRHEQPQKSIRASTHAGGDLFDLCVAPCENPREQEQTMMVAGAFKQAYPKIHDSSSGGVMQISSILEQIPSPLKNRGPYLHGSTVEYSLHNPPYIDDSCVEALCVLEPNPFTPTETSTTGGIALCSDDNMRSDKNVAEFRTTSTKVEVLSPAAEPAYLHAKSPEHATRSVHNSSSGQSERIPTRQTPCSRIREVKDASPLARRRPVNHSSLFHEPYTNNCLSSNNSLAGAAGSVNDACFVVAADAKMARTSRGAFPFPVDSKSEYFDARKNDIQDWQVNNSRVDAPSEHWGLFDENMPTRHIPFKLEGGDAVVHEIISKSNDFLHQRTHQRVHDYTNNIVSTDYSTSYMNEGSVPSTQFSLNGSELRVASNPEILKRVSSDKNRGYCEVPSWMYRDCLDPERGDGI